MNLPITLERRGFTQQDVYADEALIAKIEKASEFVAAVKNEQLPSLNKILYGKDIDELLTMKEVLGDNADE